MQSLQQIVILLQLVLALLSNPATANNPTAQSLAAQAIGYATQAIATMPTSTVFTVTPTTTLSVVTPFTITVSNPQVIPTPPDPLPPNFGVSIDNPPQLVFIPVQVANPQMLDSTWRFNWIHYAPDNTAGYDVEFSVGGKSTGGKLADGNPIPVVTATLDGAPATYNQFFGVSAGMHQLGLTITSGNRYAIMSGIVNIVASSSDAQQQTTSTPVITWQ